MKLMKTFLTVFIVSGLLAVTGASSSFAAVWHNDAENETYNNAHSGYGNPSQACIGAFGAIWATGSASDRYNMSVSVSADTDKVPIYIRGSAYLCPGVTGSSIYAIRISSNGGLPFSKLSSTTLDRGQVISGQFSTTSKYITAELDISSVSKDPGVYKQNIKIYRCASNDGINLTGSENDVCDTQTVPITITRSYNYELTPKITTDSGNSYTVNKEAGESVKINPVVNNLKAAKTRNTEWKLTYFEVKSEESTVGDNQIDNNTSDTCSVYSSTVSGEDVKNGCTVKASGQNRTFNNNGDNSFSDNEISQEIRNFTIPGDAALGTRYCFALSINPYKMNKTDNYDDQSKVSNQWRHSAPVCIQVVKKPKMQVWGASAWASGGVQMSVTKVNNTTFGSWAEYELVSPKLIKSMASASGYSGGVLSTEFKQIAKLTPRTDSELGNYESSWSGNSTDIINNFRSRYEAEALTGWDYSKLNNNGRIVAYKTSNISLGNITLVNGQSAVIFVNGDLNIDGDIITDLGSATSPYNIPQMVIIASGNINIQNNVTRVDAWLLSEKDLKTCAVVKSSVNQNNCGNQLVINGPTVANNVKSWRTAGSSGDFSSPAEIYNLRADAYLWLHSRSGGDGKIITTYTNELPVRF